MNKNRRSELEKIKSRLEDILQDLETLKGEEEEYIDNMPENLQESERAQAAQAAFDEIDEATDNVSNAIGNIETAVS